MRLIVDHLTHYRYDMPVRAVVQSHRLTPSQSDGQRTISWQVTVSDGQMTGTVKIKAIGLVADFKATMRQLETRI